MAVTVRPLPRELSLHNLYTYRKKEHMFTLKGVNPQAGVQEKCLHGAHRSRHGENGDEGGGGF